MKFAALLCALLLPATASALEITAYGALPNGSDCTPALTAAMAAATAGSDKTIHFPAGDWTFRTTPPAITGAQQIVGEGKSTTILRRAYQGGEFFYITGNGVGVRRLTIYADQGTSGGIAIHPISSDTIGAGGNHEIVDVWVTGLGTWAIPIFLDGASRTIAPAGLRAVSLRNVDVFNATSWAMEWWNCIACEWFGGGAYQGFGTTQALAVGGALGTENLIHAQIDQAASTIWAGQLRAPVQ